MESTASDKASIRFHGWADSDSSIQKDGQFVRVINEGMAEFSRLEIKKHIDRIDFRKITNLMLSTDGSRENKSRGNLQINVLFTGGENQRRDFLEVRDHYGCAMPALNVGTEEWIEVAVEMSHIARKLGIPWVVDPSESTQERNRIFANSVHPKNVLEGMTIACMEIYPNPGRINTHRDVKNCPELTETFSLTVCVPVGNSVHRTNIIGYMRKVCLDTMVRRAACQELANGCMSYLQDAQPCQVPHLTASAHESFYNCMGDMGLGLLVERNTEEDTCKVRFASLLNRPHITKSMSYVSPVANMIDKLYQRHPYLTVVDLVSLCLPVGHLSGLFNYLGVLQDLSLRPNLESDPSLGLLEIVMTLLVETAGSYSGGGFRRSQVSWNLKEISRERMESDIKVIKDMCLKSREVSPGGRPYPQYCQESFVRYLRCLKDQIRGAGDFTGSHLLTVLVQVGLLKPVGMLNCGMLATSTALFKKGKTGRPVSNPMVSTYVNALRGTGNDCGRRDRAIRLMESVLPHIQLTYPGVERCHIEQINCERNRGEVVYDFYAPGTAHIFLPPFSAPRSNLLQVMRPVVDPETGNILVESGPYHRDSARREYPDLRKCTPGNISLVSSRKVKPLVAVRIPMEYLDVFYGLKREIRSKFFFHRGAGGELVAPDSGELCGWLGGHFIISKLIKHFAVNPLPKKYNALDLHAGNLPTADLRKNFRSPGFFFEEFAATLPLPPVMASRSVLNAQYPLPLAPVPSHDAEIVARTTLGGGTSASKRRRSTGGIEQADESHGFDVIPESESESDNSSRASVPGKRRKNVDRTSCKHDQANEISDPLGFATLPAADDSKTEESPFLVCLEATFRHYRLVGASGMSLVMRGSKGLPPHKRLAAGSKVSLKLGPAHAELKNALYHGLCSTLMPKGFAKGCFIPVECSDMTHDYSPCFHQGNTSDFPSMYMTRLFGHGELDFYIVGQCLLVDKIAIHLGGRAFPCKTFAATENWLFPTQASSRRFLFQCLFLTAGKPSYFKSLYYRICKMVRKRQLKQSDGSHVVVDLVLPQEGHGVGVSPTLFHAIVYHPLLDPKMRWLLVPALERPNPDAKALYIDCWSWKSDRSLVPPDVGSSPVQPSSGSDDSAGIFAALKAEPAGGDSIDFMSFVI